MLKSYHLAWLEAHPHRSIAWLLHALKDGFDIHHIDGDHDNDSPNNLLLIEHADHMMIHNGSKPHVGRLAPPKGPRKNKRIIDLPDGRRIRRLPREQVRHAIRRFMRDPRGEAWRLEPESRG